MSTEYDEAKWDDMQWEADQERYYEAIEEELAERKIEEIIQSIKDGYESCKDIIGEIIYELEKLDLDVHPQSFVFSNLTLLEIAERDIIFFPLLFSNKRMLNDKDGKINELIRDAVGRNANTTAFVCRLYTHSENNFDKTKIQIDTAIATEVPAHKLFESQKNPIKYRELITTYRNAIIHGKGFSTRMEAKFISDFVNIWREGVFNPVLHKYGFELNQNWELV